eukprot:7232100-Prymnesium_polylepis.1
MARTVARRSQPSTSASCLPGSSVGSAHGASSAAAPPSRSSSRRMSYACGGASRNAAENGRSEYAPRTAWAERAPR